MCSGAFMDSRKNPWIAWNALHCEFVLFVMIDRIMHPLICNREDTLSATNCCVPQLFPCGSLSTISPSCDPSLSSLSTPCTVRSSSTLCCWSQLVACTRTFRQHAILFGSRSVWMTPQRYGAVCLNIWAICARPKLSMSSMHAFEALKCNPDSAFDTLMTSCLNRVHNCLIAHDTTVLWLPYDNSASRMSQVLSSVFSSCVNDWSSGVLMDRRCVMKWVMLLKDRPWICSIMCTTGSFMYAVPVRYDTTY